MKTNLVQGVNLHKSNEKELTLLRDYSARKIHITIFHHFKISSLMRQRWNSLEIQKFLIDTQQTLSVILLFSMCVGFICQTGNCGVQHCKQCHLQQYRSWSWMRSKVQQWHELKQQDVMLHGVETFCEDVCPVVFSPDVFDISCFTSLVFSHKVISQSDLTKWSARVTAFLLSALAGLGALTKTTLLLTQNRKNHHAK